MTTFMAHSGPGRDCGFSTRRTLVSRCADKASREHIISAGIFPEGTIHVKGFPWCRDEFKEIGVSSFTKKVLCEQHNNTLTHADEAGISAMNVFRQEVHINNARDKMKPRRWTVKKFLEMPIDQSADPANDSYSEAG